jgi:hypothetical protein
MKRILGAVVAAAIALTGGVALAHGPGMGQGAGHDTGTSAASMRKFQKETLGLRDELAAKRLDLQEEYDKAEPNSGRIASLKKEIVDLEAKIQVAADKYGVRSWGHGHGRGMMHANDGSGSCGCW